MRSVIVAAALLLTACATPAPTASAPALAGTNWTLDSLGGADPGAAMHRPTLSFEAARAHGNAGCNAWSADFTQSGRDLRFGSALHTMMACSRGMDVEQHFMAAIDATRHAGMSGDALVLQDKDGRELARFSHTPDSQQGS